MTEPTSHHALLFSDGASQGNPGPSGWAAIVLVDKTVVELGGAFERSTNNRMELLAAVEALEKVRSLGVFPAVKVELRTDSKFVIDGATKWTRGWVARGWTNQEGKPVSHQDLWERMIVLVTALRPQFTLVKGHSGVAGNERCDQIATAFAASVATKSDAPVLFSGLEAHYAYDLRKTQTFEPFYLSYVEQKLERHRSWAECEARVRGKTGARYKKISSSIEEAATLAQWGVNSA